MISDLVNSSDLRILLNVFIAMVLGGVIGYDREKADKPAGLRTHVLVAGGSALIVSLSGILVVHFSALHHDEMIRTDPIRIVEAVITGVSFLGAGTIIRNSSTHIEGLTTAASLIFVAGIGICVALSSYFVAMSITILSIMVLASLGKWEKKFIRVNKTKS